MIQIYCALQHENSFPFRERWRQYAAAHPEWRRPLVEPAGAVHAGRSLRRGVAGRADALPMVRPRFLQPAAGLRKIPARSSTYCPISVQTCSKVETCRQSGPACVDRKFRACAHCVTPCLPGWSVDRSAFSGWEDMREADGYCRSELLSQSRRLPVGLPGPHAGPGIYPPDRGGGLDRRLPDQLEVQRLPRHPRPHL